MSEPSPTQHTAKKDRYSRSRGGTSNFLNIFCSRCRHHIALYQKDGTGNLLRIYLDRIFEPSELAVLQNTATDKKDLPTLCCPNCKSVIGVPMVYEPERRLAFRMTHGAFSKENSDGTYTPPKPPDGSS